MAEISILTPDGRTKNYALTGDRIGLGRAVSNELCFPEDGGLSRQHLFFERDGTDWAVRDNTSKNGTVLNGERVTAARKLKPGDRILAGHLTIVYDGGSGRPFNETVVFIDTSDDRPTATRQAMELLQTGTKALVPDKGPVSADRVNALIRAGRELAGHRPLDELFPLILDLAIEAVHAERGILMTVEGDSLVVKASSGGSFRISSGVRDRVVNEGVSILVNDVMSDEAFRGMQSLVAQQVRMLMAVPLQTNDAVLGLIYVDSPTLVQEFTVEDRDFLTVMANVAAIRIEHARLNEVEQAEKILAKDLEQAAIIQRQLLPATAPSCSGIDMAAHNAACRTVGGDYYDFICYQDARVAVMLGDVSGKAMPAALLMTSLQARVRVLAEQPLDPADLVTRLNKHTAANCPSNRFISFFFSIVDPRTGEIFFANAGHNPPFLIRADGSAETLEGGGLIMGLFPQARYETQRAALGNGDVLVLYSDGVTEATNAANEEFGEDRLMEVLRAARDLPAKQIAERVTSAVSEFAAGAPAADDLTLVVVKKTS